MTASAVIPLVKLMISDMESAAEYPVAAQAIANKLKMELQKYEEVEYLNIATALDPRFKVLLLFFPQLLINTSSHSTALVDVRFAKLATTSY